MNTPLPISIDRLYERLGWAVGKITEPRPLATLFKEAAQVALEESGGKKAIAALSLGISLYRFNQCLRGLGVFLIFASTMASAAQFSAPPADVPPSPKSALLTSALRLAVAPPKTNGSVRLQWASGDSPQTLISYSNRTTYPVGSASIATVTGLEAGSTNSFAVTNLAGASNIATGVATRGTNRINQLGTITIYAADRISGRTNWLIISTNLLTWQRSVNMGTNSGSYTFLVTNASTGSMFYQTLTE